MRTVSDFDETQTPLISDRRRRTVTPDATDSRHTTARTLGIPIIKPADGWTRLSEAIRKADLKAVERQRSIYEAVANRQQRAAENDAYWRPTWRTDELDHDPAKQHPLPCSQSPAPSGRLATTAKFRGMR